MVCVWQQIFKSPRRRKNTASLQLFFFTRLVSSSLPDIKNTCSLCLVHLVAWEQIILTFLSLNDNLVQEISQNMGFYEWSKQSIVGHIVELRVRTNGCSNGSNVCKNGLRNECSINISKGYQCTNRCNIFTQVKFAMSVMWQKEIINRIQNVKNKTLLWLRPKETKCMCDNTFSDVFWYLIMLPTTLSLTHAHTFSLHSFVLSTGHQLLFRRLWNLFCTPCSGRCSCMCVLLMRSQSLSTLCYMQGNLGPFNLLIGNQKANISSGDSLRRERQAGRQKGRWSDCTMWMWSSELETRNWPLRIHSACLK